MEEKEKRTKDLYFLILVGNLNDAD